MANLSILDTGYLTPTNTGTRLTSANMSNAGAEIALKAVSFKPATSQKVDITPPLGVYGTGDIIDSTGSSGNVVAVENVSISISGILDLTDATDQALIIPLMTLARTKGYKILYYNSTGTDKSEQLIYNLSTDTISAGEATAYSITSGIKHLHVRITSCDFINTAGKNNLSYSLKGVVIKSETSTI